MPDAAFLRKIRDIAQDSHRVIITEHARKRMRSRRVTLPQVIECLRKGTVSEPVHQDISGNWKATLAHRCAGDLVRVAVAILERDDGSMAAVITVMN